MSDAVAEQKEFVSLTAEFVSAYLSNNHIRADDLPGLIQEVHAALAQLAVNASGGPASVEKATPTEIKRSITPDYLVSFEDGKRYKTLRRHLMGGGLPPEEYRATWGLPVDYPMTSASYSAQRAELARSSGLGRLRQNAPAEDQG